MISESNKKGNVNLLFIYRLFQLSILLAVISPACKENKPLFSQFTGYAQGTTYSIVYESIRRITPESIKEDVEKILYDFDMSLSIYKDSSIISKINHNEKVLPDSYFIDVFKKSQIIFEMTDGALDITVGPLVRAWGFGPDEHKDFRVEKLDSLMNLVGMGKVSLVEGRLVKDNPGIYLDMNAIAQGYSVDVLCRYFDKLGIKNYLVEIGGEVRAKGTKAGALWRIGIDKPTDNNLSPGETIQAIIRLSDESLATSGNYRKFYVEDGIKYSHTIDPKTGYPAKNRLLSATIIAEDCTTADGIATACMVMGLELSIKFINDNPQLRGYLVFSDDNGNFLTWISENLEDNISESE